MGVIANSLVAKLEAAGLSDEEKAVLALATLGSTSDDAEVEGFARSDLASLGRDVGSGERLDQFEIQHLTSSFNKAETLFGTIFLGPIVGT